MKRVHKRTRNPSGKCTYLSEVKTVVRLQPAISRNLFIGQETVSVRRPGNVRGC